MSLFLYSAYNPANKTVSYQVRYMRVDDDGKILVDVMLVPYTVFKYALNGAFCFLTNRMLSAPG